jgi:hypothetical protein
MLIGVLASLVAIYAAVTGARRLARGLREASSLAVVRAIRRLVTAVAAAVVALAMLVGEHGLLVFAAVFLAEELYETGVLALILRASAAPSG